MLDNLRADARRLELAGRLPYPWSLIESLLFDNGFQAVVLYRMASALKRWRIPLLGPAIARLSVFLTGVDISPSAEIGPGLRISHGVGTVVGGAARIGPGAVLLHQVTLGSPSERRVGEMPTLGANVFVSAGAKLIGKIEVGDDVVIGPNAVVTEDVPGQHKVLAASGVEIAPRRKALAPAEPPADA
jgi:serine O-acetyltransferase